MREPALPTPGAPRGLAAAGVHPMRVQFRALCYTIPLLLNAHAGARFSEDDTDQIAPLGRWRDPVSLRTHTRNNGELRSLASLC